MEWFLQFTADHPALGAIWFIWVTFHDFVQWGIMALLGLTVLGQRKKARRKKEIEDMVRAEVAHIHEELHQHIEEDIELHGALGQNRGLSEGTWPDKG